MSDFKVGDDVVCLNAPCNGLLTNERAYKVLCARGSRICVKNDGGFDFWYAEMRFKPKQMDGNNWKPKVGEPCIFNEVGEMPEITPKFVGDDHVVFMRNGVECVNNIKYFSPLKTPAEIEQNRIIDKALNTLGHSRGDFTIVSILKQLYHANLLSDKQVKTLSYEDFEEMYISTDYRPILYKKLNPYTIQDGAK